MDRKNGTPILTSKPATFKLTLVRDGKETTVEVAEGNVFYYLSRLKSLERRPDFMRKLYQAAQDNGSTSKFTRDEFELLRAKGLVCRDKNGTPCLHKDAVTLIQASLVISEPGAVLKNPFGEESDKKPGWIHANLALNDKELK